MKNELIINIPEYFQKVNTSLDYPSKHHMRAKQIHTRLFDNYKSVKFKNIYA